ncbi:MAG TPA: UbiX family flavin prenyltransferase [Clostridia bacterium]|nr:UbiX family flavin prenyltransferase [Clostridia bacterium]
MKIIVGISGASGAIYGIRLLEELKKRKVETHLIMSRWGAVTIAKETDYTVEQVNALADKIYREDDVSAAISSGSFQTGGMIVAPCSMKTLSGIANGYAEDLMTRAADVCIKERRKLILVARETPLNAIHLENMLKLSRIGVEIMPPVPAFYSRPQSIDDIVNHTVGRIMDHIGLENRLFTRWGE